MKVKVIIAQQSTKIEIWAKEKELKRLKSLLATK